MKTKNLIIPAGNIDRFTIAEALLEKRIYSGASQFSGENGKQRLLSIIKNSNKTSEQINTIIAQVSK